MDATKSFLKPPLACVSPVYLQSKGIFVPCCKCPACLNKKSQEWALRLRCEALLHKKACTVLLTYDDSHLPEGANLVKTDVVGHSGVIHRARCEFRRLYGYSVNFRYFVSGEYGSMYGRPHYHILLLGIEYGHPFIQVLMKCWGKCDLNRDWSQPIRDSASMCKYISSYVVKKIGSSFVGKDVKEFSSCSNRPGIGKYFVDVYQKMLALGYNGLGNYRFKLGDKEFFLPRYMRQKLEDTMDTTIKEFRTMVREFVNNKAMLDFVEQFMPTCFKWKNYVLSDVRFCYDKIVEFNMKRVESLLQRWNLYEKSKSINQASYIMASYLYIRSRYGNLQGQSSQAL